MKNLLRPFQVKKYNINITKSLAMPAGYSGRPSIKKLGIKPETKLVLKNASEDYGQLLEADLSAQLAGKNEKPDMIHQFAKNKKALQKGLQQAK